MWLSNPTVSRPVIQDQKGVIQTTLYPFECRERGISYKAKLQVKVHWTINDGPVQSEVRSFGYLPIMVKVF